LSDEALLESEFFETEPPQTDFRLSNNETPMGEELGPIYQQRPDPKDFFVVGRVFAMLWHEAAKDPEEEFIDQATSSTVGNFEQIITSQIIRMVVVKSCHGYCWCVPMKTYNTHARLPLRISHKASR
jgi:hypothetical protein